MLQTTLNPDVTS